MRSTLSILALAGSAAATGWKESQPFKCPSNTNNQCSPDQSSGYDFGELPSGSFSNYGGMNWGGWSCNAGGKRFQPRTGGKSVGGKSISGSCGHDKSSSPSFGCGADAPDFSVSTYHVQPEFDCDLEFHYGMPDGSTCKHRNACSKSGTTITNSQCGGAKNVTVVFPSGQPSKPKPSCSVTLSSISFDCSTASSTVPVKTTSPAETTSVVFTQPTRPAETEKTTRPAESTTVVFTQPTRPAETEKTTRPAETTSVVFTQPTRPAETEDTTRPAESTTVVFTQPTRPAETEDTTRPAESTTVVFTQPTRPAETEKTTRPEETEKTKPTKGGASSSQRPFGNSTVIETGTTEAHTSVAETHISVVETISSVVKTNTRGEGSPATITTAVTSSAVASASSSASSPAEALPCPGVVPSCLNTFIWMTGCSDNSDAGCFCMEAIFINNVYDCMYAHGGSDSEVSEAVSYLMGLCGGFAAANPAVATGATVTSYLTVTATSVASVYTTLTVHATTVEAWTDSAGAIVPGSSSTVVVSTAITVPQVGFTTDSAGAVGVVPATSVSWAAAATGASSGSGSDNGSSGGSDNGSGSGSDNGSGIAYTTAAAGSSADAVGTIGATGVSPSPTDIVFGGAGRTSAAGFGAALAVMGLVAVL